MSTSPGVPNPDTGHIWISQGEGTSSRYQDPQGKFSIAGKGKTDAHRLMNMDAYSAGMAFVNRDFEIDGDVLAAVRYFSNHPHSRFRERLFSVLARLEHLRIFSLLGGRHETAEGIQYHYDRSNEFYAQFLDSRMVYSAAHFESPGDSLDQAQLQKLDLICRDLELVPGERFLDLGSGWGGLVTHAAVRYGVHAYGCTLSPEQLRFAHALVKQSGIEDRVTVQLCDYRDLTGEFDKIASVGMFEHVGRSRLRAYFAKVHALLKEGGLFLNRGAMRPEASSDGADTLFIQKEVFPGGELVHLSEVIREGERGGFDVVGVRDYRIHYARTCAAWVKNLQRNADQCRALVGERTYRTWLLYLAASSVGFEQGRISAGQVLFQRR